MFAYLWLMPSIVYDIKGRKKAVGIIFQGSCSVCLISQGVLHRVNYFPENIM